MGEGGSRKEYTKVVQVSLLLHDMLKINVKFREKIK
jgi:hypothetical protein